MKTRLSSARRVMHARFPFSEQLWMEWLDDEIAASSGRGCREAIATLFALAVKDYLSVPIWVRYLK